MNLGVIGKYRLIRSLGKGGMGEVFLAQDTICNRQVALKKIREDLLKHPSIKSRFLGEAHIAAQLTHPSIVPIFSIHTDEQLLFYTMPYVEGDTLKEVLRASKSENNVSALIRIFLSVCQAIAYCHSKQIIHRDIKPENIIVGKFGEVLLLDWGIADYLGGNSDEFAVDIPTAAHLTKPGKVVGTLTYLAPERAKGEWGSEQSDLYSLGVILYQILTLKLPFKRVDLATFKKNMNFEELIDPIEAAPYRDIPRKLAEITKKCLAFHKEERYSHVSELVAEIEAYHEGRAEWMVAKDLEINRKEDWEFQENILLTKHLALAHSSDLTEWVSLMISKLSFTGNTKVEAKIRIGKDCEGIGFLMNIQEVNNRKNLMDGYYLLIGSKKQPGFHLYLSNIEVMQAADCILVPDRWYHLKIEKSDTHLRVYLDHSLKCHYISHTPLGGAHVGLLYRDTDFEIEHFNISIGSQDALISCLAVPDAFLANKNYSKALNEYRRIAYSFPGRSEEREATFRAGISLLEHGLTVKNRKKRGMLFNAALDEFSKLRNSAGAPLEYLGKSLVYKSLGEVTEEVKCLELSIRKYVNHPLQPRIVEHLIFRLYETSHHNRLEAYHFSLLCLRQLPTIFYNMENQKLVDSLKKNWESLYFLEHTATTSVSAIYLAFLLAKPLTLQEIVNSNKDVSDALFALLELGFTKIVKSYANLSDYPEIQAALSLVPRQGLSTRTLIYLFQKALDSGEVDKILAYLPENLSTLLVWGYLYEGRYQAAKLIFDRLQTQEYLQVSSPLYPLYGCYLRANEGEKAAKNHFSNLLETAYPHTSALLGFHVNKTMDIEKSWTKRAFPWEKVQLYRYLILYYRCSNDIEKVKHYTKKLVLEKTAILKQ